MNKTILLFVCFVTTLSAEANQTLSLDTQEVSLYVEEVSEQVLTIHAAMGEVSDSSVKRAPDPTLCFLLKESNDRIKELAIILAKMGFTLMLSEVDLEEHKKYRAAFVVKPHEELISKLAVVSFAATGYCDERIANQVLRAGTVIVQYNRTDQLQLAISYVQERLNELRQFHKDLPKLENPVMELILPTSVASGPK